MLYRRTWSLFVQLVVAVTARGQSHEQSQSQTYSKPVTVIIRHRRSHIDICRFSYRVVVRSCSGSLVVTHWDIFVLLLRGSGGAQWSGQVTVLNIAVWEFEMGKFTGKLQYNAVQFHICYKGIAARDGER